MKISRRYRYKNKNKNKGKSKYKCKYKGKSKCKGKCKNKYYSLRRGEEKGGVGENKAPEFSTEFSTFHRIGETAHAI